MCYNLIFAAVICSWAFQKEFVTSQFIEHPHFCEPQTDYFADNYPFEDENKDHFAAYVMFIAKDSYFYKLSTSSQYPISDYLFQAFDKNELSVWSSQSNLLLA